ncbi:MAG: hypothetical protein GY854_05615 [Deltaproteobacteria bacterium]|nr:hypothetical protein [Deltaproteobacteria bacterium]
MKDETTHWSVSLSRSGLLVCALGFVALYLGVAFFRIGYPFELEWLEGGVLDHIRRILAGEKLYVEPSLEFVPFVYTPLYYYLSAAVSRLTGVGFVSLRAVSICASAGCFFVIFLYVLRETRALLPSIAAAGLFAASFRAGGAWFDLARVDSLFLVTLLGAVYLIRFHVSARSHVLAGILIVLSFLTKQTALVMAVPLAAACLVRNGRTGLYFAATVIVLVGAGTVLFDSIYDGWYTYYVFELPRSHSFESEMILRFWTKNLLVTMPIALFFSAMYLFVAVKGDNREGGISVALIAVALIGGSWVSSLHSGSYDNVILPAYAGLSILFGAALNAIIETLYDMGAKKTVSAQTILYLVCIGQFGLLAYNPSDQIPSEEDKTAGEALVKRISKIEGDVLIPRHGYLSRMAGKKGCAHEMAMNDVLRGGVKESGAGIKGQILTALEEQKFGAIIVNYNWLTEDIKRYYRKAPGRIFESEDVFWPVTGLRTRPEHLYLPQSKDSLIKHR